MVGHGRGATSALAVRLTVKIGGFLLDYRRGQLLDVQVTVGVQVTLRSLLLQHDLARRAEDFVVYLPATNYHTFSIISAEFWRMVYFERKTNEMPSAHSSSSSFEIPWELGSEKEAAAMKSAASTFTRQLRVFEGRPGHFLINATIYSVATGLFFFLQKDTEQERLV